MFDLLAVVSPITIQFVNDDQKDAAFILFICTQSDLHVSGEIFAHHQEQLTVFTASDIVHLCCCRSVSWTRWNCVPSRP